MAPDDYRRADLQLAAPRSDTLPAQFTLNGVRSSFFQSLSSLPLDRFRLEVFLDCIHVAGQCGNPRVSSIEEKPQNSKADRNAQTQKLSNQRTSFTLSLSPSSASSRSSTVNGCSIHHLILETYTGLILQQRLHAALSNTASGASSWTERAILFTISAHRHVLEHAVGVELTGLCHRRDPPKLNTSPDDRSSLQVWAKGVPFSHQGGSVEVADSAQLKPGERVVQKIGQRLRLLCSPG